MLLSCAIHYSLPVPRAWLWVIAERSEYSSVDPQRLEQDVGIVEGKHIRRCQFAGVLGDDGIRRLLRSRVQVRLEDGPAVPSWSVLLKEGRRVEACHRSADTGLEVGDILFLQFRIGTTAKAPKVTADQRLPCVAQGHIVC